MFGMKVFSVDLINSNNSYKSMYFKMTIYYLIFGPFLMIILNLSNIFYMTVPTFIAVLSENLCKYSLILILIVHSILNLTLTIIILVLDYKEPLDLGKLYTIHDSKAESEIIEEPNDFYFRESFESRPS